MARLSLSTKKKLQAVLNVLIVYLRTIFVACATSCFYSWYRFQKRLRSPSPSQTVIRVYKQLEYLHGLIYESDVTCISELRMDRRSFHRLCQVLVTRGQLRATRNVSIQEMVAFFLYILAHHLKNRTINHHFRRSGRTISKYFHEYLKAMIRCQKDFWQTPEPIPENSTDPKWKWFKNCLGALDVESRIKTLKAKYFALTELLALSGFEWNEEKMMLACEKSVYDETTKGKKDASGLYDKPFPHYHSLGEIYAKDRAVGANAGNADDDEEEVRLEDANVNQNEGEDESGNDFDTSFSVPNTQQQRNAESNTSNNSRKRARVGDEMAKQFYIMAKAIADVGPKLDGLVHALSTDKNLTEMQQKLDGELSKMEFLSPMELFQVTNFLAKEHDLLRVFFNMSDERKSAYVTTLLQTWMHNDV